MLHPKVECQSCLCICHFLNCNYELVFTIVKSLFLFFTLYKHFNFINIVNFPHVPFLHFKEPSYANILIHKGPFMNVYLKFYKAIILFFKLWMYFKMSPFSLTVIVNHSSIFCNKFLKPAFDICK